MTDVTRRALERAHKPDPEDPVKRQRWVDALRRVDPEHSEVRVETLWSRFVDVAGRARALTEMAPLALTLVPRLDDPLCMNLVAYMKAAGWKMKSDYSPFSFFNTNKKQLWTSNATWVFIHRHAEIPVDHEWLRLWPWGCTDPRIREFCARYGVGVSP